MIQIQRGTSESLQSQNPTIADGQTVVERDEEGYKIKIGDGVTPFNDLEYPLSVNIPNSIVEQLQFSILNKLYPIGTIYYNNNSTNPGELLGFGTWHQFGAGRVIACVGQTQESGQSMVTIQEGETGGYTDQLLLTHTHTMYHTHSDTFSIADSSSHTHTINHGHSDNFSIASVGNHVHNIGADHDAYYTTMSNSSYSVHRNGSTTVTGAELLLDTSSAGSHTHTLNGAVTNYSGSSGSSGAHTHTLNGSVSTYSGSSGAAGQSLPSKSNYPPYIAVYAWVRIS